MNDLIDKIDLFLDTKRRPITDYRQSLYSKVVYDSYHKETPKGHVIVVKQYRKDFYKPRGYAMNEEDFFGMNQLLRNMRMQALVDNSEKEIKNFLTQIKELFEEGYVLHHWDMKEIKALQFVGQQELDFIEQLKVKDIPILPGHIRAIRYNKPQYENHKPMVTDTGMEFYYRTSWSPQYKKDQNLAGNEFKFESDEVIEQGNYTVVSCPDEEPLIISEI